MQEYVIIVAGGTGSRMKSDIPKQFIALNGLPILMHTIKAFRNYSDKLSIILVLPENQFEYWQLLCKQYSFHESLLLIAGGNTRFDSVKNGLNSINADIGLVAVHDGVRPIISKQIISESFQHASEFGSAIVSVPMKDSIRKINKDGDNISEDRTAFRLIQTPQTFRLDWMQKAFTASYQANFTDCASVLESAGYTIQLIEGAYENIKITTPEDLRWAEIYL
ncbi:2-C-methyl-D-erythritol 4-phosphate cytidylyltransferase [Dyadobacter sp. NIV53]|uniref:2-C-methyl-D-erythritol 4-phosphate cytidylyltransferase n=1 Tax=Dyadobacter sp. NIV53 TaxID=2861765 RepID=UPI001C87EE73|nr:2-C-methyl-D-erythritol 4-phosphate cytidylyltransferase [Dyadobacter sp. NIV53]